MASTEQTKLEVDKLRASHGKIAEVELELQDKTIITLCFRRPKKDEITVMNKNNRTQPEMSVEHAIGLCRSCFIGPCKQEEFEQATKDFCLAFAGSQEFTGVAEHLVKLSTGEAKITVK